MQVFMMCMWGKPSRFQGYHISFQGGLVDLAFYVDKTVGEDRMVYGQL